MNHRKKVLFCIESLHCGGAEKSLVTLLQNLDYSKYNIDLLMIKGGGEFERWLPSSLNVVYFNIFDHFNFFSKFLFRIRYYLSKRKNVRLHDAEIFWKTIQKKIPNQVQQYDVAISYSQGFCTYFVASKVNATLKYTWLNTDYNSAGYNLNFDWQYYQKYNKVICVSDAGKSAFQQALSKININIKIDVIQDIADKELIIMQSHEPISVQFDRDKINIITVCRLEPPKGLEMAMEAVARLAISVNNFHWYFIGEGSERPRLEKFIEKLNIRDKVTLLGFKDNPYPYMVAADIYVQTSRYEGLGLTLIEAVILQKPVVTTNFDTAKMIVADGENGLIATMESADIAYNILRLINDSDLRHSLTLHPSEKYIIDKQTSLNQVNMLLD